MQVWALEHDGSGKRSYVVASRGDFWKRYRTLHAPFRHYYELIRTGQPCHLYLDLEFCKHANPDVDGDGALATLHEELVAALGRSYFDGVRPDCHVIDLDSSTAQKWSRHLIIHLPGAAFADNNECGRFVHATIAALVARRAEDTVGALFVAPPAREQAETPGTTPLPQVSLVDLSVYSRNRCFRLYKSCKAGKVVQLLPANRSEEELWFLPHQEETALFMDSLVTNVPRGVELLRGPEPSAAEEASTCTPAGWVQAEPQSSDSGAAPTASAASANSAASAAPTNLSAASGAPVVLLPRPPRAGGVPGGLEAPMHSGEWPERLRELFHFVVGAWAAKTGLTTNVRTWSVDLARGRLTLALGPSNRWCAHVLRPHRSNGTLLHVDLRRETFAQFCFDGDCRAAGFRGSDSLPIPPALCQAALGQPWSNQRPGGAAEAMELSEEVLAAVPLDELVEAHRRREQERRCVEQMRRRARDAGEVGQPPPSRAELADGDAAEDDWMVSDEALAALEGV